MSEELNTNGHFLVFLIGVLRELGLDSDETHLLDRLRVRVPLELPRYIRGADISAEDARQLQELTQWLQTSLWDDSHPGEPPPTTLVRSTENE